MASDDAADFFDDDSECWNCGGEGFVYGCSWDWQCDTWDGDSCLCTRPCHICNPPKDNPELRARVSDGREAVERLLTLIETAHEHGDEMAIVEQATAVRSALATLSPDDKLREAYAKGWTDGEGRGCEGIEEAADTITKLRAEVEELTTDRDLWKQSEETASRQHDKLLNENERLRGALRQMVNDADRNQRPGGGSSVPDWVHAALGDNQ